MNRRTLIGALVTALSLGRAAAQAALPALSVHDAHEGQRAGILVLVDIRSPEEWADTGVPPGAIRLDAAASAFEARLAALRLEHRGKPLALISRTGNQSRELQVKLAARGWRDLVYVRGGMLGSPGEPGWLAQKLPVSPYP